VSPSITATATAADIVTVTGGVFQDPAITTADLQVMVGATTLQPKTGATLVPGQFETINPSTLRFEWPSSGFHSGDVAPLRILVNGVENAPTWVVAP
jgi:hypothetical protein